MLRAVEHGWLQTESTENAKKIVDDATETMARVQAEVARQNRSIEDVRQQLPSK